MNFISEEILPSALQIGDWFKITDNEVSTVKRIERKVNILIVTLTNRNKYHLHKLQHRVERVIYMGSEA